MMNWAHVHLILNHLPVIGMVFSLLLLLVAMLRKSEELKLTSLKFFVLLGVVVIPTYLTGDPAAGVVRPLPGVSRQLIEQHDAAATVALTGVLILAAVAVVGLFLAHRAKALPAWSVTASLILAVLLCGWLAWTADLGGRIRHPEVRPGFQTGPAAGTLGKQ